MEIMLKVMVAAVLVRLNMDGHVMEHLQFDRSVEMARQKEPKYEMMGIRRLEMDEVAREHWKLDGLEMELYYRFDKSEEMESKRELRCEMMEI